MVHHLVRHFIENIVVVAFVDDYDHPDHIQNYQCMAHMTKSVYGSSSRLSSPRVDKSPRTQTCLTRPTSLIFHYHHMYPYNYHKFLTHHDIIMLSPHIIIIIMMTIAKIVFCAGSKMTATKGNCQ